MSSKTSGRDAPHYMSSGLVSFSDFAAVTLPLPFFYFRFHGESLLQARGVRCMDFGVAVTCGLPEKRVFNEGK